MAFLDELSKRFTEVVKKVGEKSEELVGLGKLNYEIYKEEEAVRKLYSQIGQAVYEAYSKENSSINAIYNLCKEIDRHRERIESLKREVESIKAGTKVELIAEARTGDNEGAVKQQEEPKQTPQEGQPQQIHQEEQPQQTQQEGQLQQTQREEQPQQPQRGEQPQQ